MEFLPSEILVSIFVNLPQSDLISLTEVCKKFHTIIEEYKLIKTIFITEKRESSPAREYREAVVERYEPDSHQKVFEATGDQLKMLKFVNCTVNLVDILRILQLTANVESLSFSYVRLDNDRLDNGVDLPQLSNLNLLFEESNPEIFNVFMKSSFSKIDLRFFADVPYSNFRPLVNLLKTQEKLTSIAFSGIYESNLFLIPMGKPKYQLKEFYIDNCDFEEWDGLETFLAEHSETIEKFTVKNLRWDPSTTLNHFVKLKKLEVAKSELNFLGNLKSVEELSVKPPLRTMDNFPNVKRLSLGLSTPQANQIASDAMPKVEELEINQGEVGGISFPSLKTLNITSAMGLINHDFFTQHNKIENLTISNYFDLNDNLLEAISTALIDLKILRIFGDNHLTSRAFQIVRENCKNLKVIEMAQWIQKFERGDWKVLEEINGLQVYTENI